MPRAWNDWYHVIGNTYGTWLYGSNLGFRTRHHREHVEGDYKNPPPPGKYGRELDRSRKLMKRAPIHLAPEARRVACHAIFDSLRDDRIEVVIVSVDDHHYHVLARFPEHKPRYWVGRANGRAARLLSEVGLLAPGGVWAKRCQCKPINDRAHQLETANYIRRHVRKGAAIRFHRCAPIRSSVSTPALQKPTA